MEGHEARIVEKLGAFEGLSKGAAKIEGWFEDWLDGSNEMEGPPLV